jgi:predicted flap endonuclease-1-like 5' DNA nuclease
MNPRRGGQPTHPKAANNQNAALRRLREKREREKDDDGLRRILGTDPVVEETMRKAGL